MCSGTSFIVEKISPLAGLELGTARSVGHRLTELPGLLPFLNSPKYLDTSYKMDLGFWDCFGRKNPLSYN